MAYKMKDSSMDTLEEMTREEVAARSSLGATLLVIDNVVYDVAGFLEEHPGGEQVLRTAAGDDASQCFHMVGHSEDARARRRRLAVARVPEWQMRAPPEPTTTSNSTRSASAQAVEMLRAAAPALALAVLWVFVCFYVIT